MKNNNQIFSNEKRGVAIYLSIGASCVLLMSAVGAAFAYFAANTNNSAVSKVEIIADARTTSWTSSENIEVSVTADDMSMSNTDKIVDEDAELSAQTTNSESEEIYTCTYDLIYTPSGDAVPDIEWDYNPDGLAEVELSGTVVAYSGTTSTLDGETSFSINLAGVVNETVLIDGGSYTVGVDSTAGVTWTITTTVYNRDFNQSHLAGGSYGGSVTFANLACGVE